MNRPHHIFRGRPDTMLGICEAVGQDFGFNPDFLRIGLGVALLFNPFAVVAVYAALGVVVLGSRLIWPSRPARLPVAAAADAPHAVNDTSEPELAIAA